MSLPSLEQMRIGIIGLGYVCLPLAGYPAATEEVCIPEIENVSGLVYRMAGVTA